MVLLQEQRHSVVHASSLQQSFYESLQKVGLMIDAHSILLQPIFNRSSPVLHCLGHPMTFLKSPLPSGSLVTLQIVSISSCLAENLGKYVVTM